MIHNFHPLTALSAAIASAAVVSIIEPTYAFVAPAPVTYGYSCASNNSVTDCNIAESQFSTTVSQVAADEVMFTFKNIGNQAAILTNIYFEDLLPKTLATFVKFDYSGLTSGQQVKYSPGANPDSPPSINGFEVTFSASPDAPRAPNGIGLGESLGIIFKIQEGFTNPFNAIITDLQNGSLRTAVRAQGFEGGGSETLVNQEVPEPLTLLGSMAAIAGGVALKHRSASKININKEKSLVS